MIALGFHEVPILEAGVGPAAAGPETRINNDSSFY